MKRPLTLAGFVLATLMHIAYTVSALFTLTLVIDIVTTTGINPADQIFIIVMAALELAFAVVSLIFNALCISLWNKSREEFAKKRKIVLTAIILNFVFVILMILGLSGGSASSLVVNIIAMVVLALADALIVTGLYLEKKTQKK